MLLPLCLSRAWSIFLYQFVHAYYNHRMLACWSARHARKMLSKTFDTLINMPNAQKWDDNDVTYLCCFTNRFGAYSVSFDCRKNSVCKYMLDFRHMRVNHLELSDKTHFVASESRFSYLELDGNELFDLLDLIFYGSCCIESRYDNLIWVLCRFPSWWERFNWIECGHV